MYIKNQILIQLNEANLLASSEIPHKRRLAVILFDNIIEIQLRRKIDKIFSWDCTTWYNGSRKFTRQDRDKANKGFKDMLKFALNSKWITEDEREELAFCHSIRNLSYHTGKDDSYYDQQLHKQVEIALYILYSFIETRFLEWGTCTSLIAGCPYPPQPGYKVVQFGDYKSSDPWKTVLLSILNYQREKNVSNLISEYLNSSISETIDQISYISKYLSSGYDFNYVLNQYWYLTDIFSNRIKKEDTLNDFDEILFQYSFLRKFQDHLDDIDDLNDRHQAAQDYYSGFCQKPDKYLIKWQDLEKLRLNSTAIRDKTSASAVKKFVSMRQRISNIQKDISSAYSDLDGYILSEYERYKGK